MGKLRAFKAQEKILIGGTLLLTLLCGYAFTTVSRGCIGWGADFYHADAAGKLYSK